MRILNETVLGRKATAAAGEWVVRVRYATTGGESRCVAFVGERFEEVMTEATETMRRVRVEGCTAVRVGKATVKEAA